MEILIEEEGATPATIGIVGGEIAVGLTPQEMEHLAKSTEKRKIGIRDLGAAVIDGIDGGTTVGATMFIAKKAAIQVFATGGIGGVHREHPFDISADLQALAQVPMIVVCGGAKSVLDLRATLEVLETLSVPVVGYGTDEFPGFFSRSSGMRTSSRQDSPAGIAKQWSAHTALGMTSALLVTNPVPPDSAVEESELEVLISRASDEARAGKLRGQAVTPFLLQRLNEMTAERSSRANIALLLSNARLAARIARAICQLPTNQEAEG